jgi:hypothetical protein
VRARFKIRLQLDLEPGDYERLPPWIAEHTFYHNLHEVVLYKEGEFNISEEPQTQADAIAETLWHRREDRTGGHMRTLAEVLGSVAAWVLHRRRRDGGSHARGETEEVSAMKGKKQE